MAGYTYATLTQAIQDYTDNDEAVFVSRIPDFVEAAEERILKEVPLEIFRKNATASFIAGNRYVPKPSDWLQYMYRPPSLTSTTGTTQTWLSENAGPALLYGSVVEAYTFMKGEPDMIGQYEQSFQRNLGRLNMFANAAEGLDFYRRSKD